MPDAGGKPGRPQLPRMAGAGGSRPLAWPHPLT